MIKSCQLKCLHFSKLERTCKFWNMRHCRDPATCTKMHKCSFVKADDTLCWATDHTKLMHLRKMQAERGGGQAQNLNGSQEQGGS